MKRQLSFLSIFCLVTTFAVGQTPGLWGVTPRVGTSGNGVIFKTDLDGNNYSMEAFFTRETDYGSGFNALMQAANGKIYGPKIGTATGHLYEYDISGGSIKSIGNEYLSSGVLIGTPIQAANGKLYWQTSRHSRGSFGIYEYDIATETSKRLTPRISHSSDRYDIVRHLVQASNGKLYGVSRGGTNNNGFIFEYDIEMETYSEVFHFERSTSGGDPLGGLVEHSNGKLYGLTQSGETYNRGILFAFEIATQSYTKLHEFVLATDNKGIYPKGTPVVGNDGNIYGLTQSGGQNNAGTIYTYNLTNNTLNVVYDFTTTTGSRPDGSLELGADGILYGLTQYGGDNNQGVAFSFNINTGEYKVLHHFKGRNEYSTGTLSGSLLLANDGRLYGKGSGGSSQYGLLFSIDPQSNDFSALINFRGNPKGARPQNNMMQSSRGYFYGMAESGGLYNSGVIYEYKPVSDEITTLFDFRMGVTGNNPKGRLLEASNGKFYGMSYNSPSAIFEFNPFTREYEIIHTLQSGANPMGDLIQGTDGKLYGLTFGGGNNINGTLFEYDLNTQTHTTLFHFDETTSGASPYGTLLQAANGKLYGTTSMGGEAEYSFQQYGTAFEYDIASSTFTKLLDFSLHYQDYGWGTRGNFMEHSNGKLYLLTAGTTGGILEFDPATATFTRKRILRSNGHLDAYATLMEGKNGDLYAYMNRGGDNDVGFIFTYNPDTEAYAVVHNFHGDTGGYPMYGSLLMATCYPGYNSFDIVACDTYTVPSGHETYTREGTYTVMDTIDNHCGMDSVLTINLTINITPITNVDVDICSGGNYTYADGTEVIDLELDETHTSTLVGQAFNGCDSIVIENLRVLPLAYHSAEYSLCAGLSFTYADGTEVNDIQADQSHVSTLTGAAYNGCDSIVTESLTVLPLAYSSETYSLCAGASFIFADGTEVTDIQADQSHVSTLTGAAYNGCDSIVTETLVVLPLAYHNVEYSLCAGSSFTYADGTEVNDIQTDQRHVSRLTGAAYNGCDSIVTEILTVVALDNTVTLDGNTLIANEAEATYQWLDCNMKQSPITGATSQVYVAESSGEYAVSITKTGCTVRSECVSVVITGVPQSADGHGMKVYPNPTSGMIYIDISDELLGSKIRILDLSGKLVYSGVAQSAMSEVELPLKPGIYIVEVITPDNQKKQFKVIKE